MESGGDAHVADVAEPLALWLAVAAVAGRDTGRVGQVTFSELASRSNGSNDKWLFLYIGRLKLFNS